METIVLQRRFILFILCNQSSIRALPSYCGSNDSEKMSLSIRTAVLWIEIIYNHVIIMSLKYFDQHIMVA